jgi:D-glycero-beta-D-manno-heptose 1-phosphate adenylyltransferase
MRALNKIIPYEHLVAWRNNLPANGAPLVVTNGCFDILHPGHLYLLDQARGLGNALLVGLTGDTAIRALKGPGRPTLPERDRLLLVCSLESVTHVCLFPEVNAVSFVEKSRPHIYVKGGDYTLETINQSERRALESLNAQIKIIPKFEDQSTSAILQRVLNRADSSSMPRSS